MSIEDDDNPLHKIGYGRGDDAAEEYARSQNKSRVTQAYSFIDTQRVINVGERVLEPTVEMIAMETLTVKDVIHRLIERNLQAWRALPERVRDRIIERPQDFQLIGNKERKSNDGSFDYNILYNGTVWCYNPTALVWTISEIVR